MVFFNDSKNMIAQPVQLQKVIDFIIEHGERLHNYVLREFNTVVLVGFENPRYYFRVWGFRFDQKEKLLNELRLMTQSNQQRNKYIQDPLKKMNDKLGKYF